MTQDLDAALLLDCRCELGEGIQWRGDTQRLYWTDIHGKRFWSCDAEGGAAVTVDLPERLGSFAFDPAGAILAAFESGLFRVDPATWRRERLSDFEPDRPSTRYNDGRCDRQGRFLAGGMNEDGLKPSSSLTRYGAAAGVETLGVETLAAGIGCSNAIAFSPDGRRLYFADTPTRTIRAYDYDPAGGPLGRRAVFAEMAEDEGFPDGACVDAEGRLWNAQFNGARVQCFTADGERRTRVRLPVPQVTCCCFGGPALDRLYITTARENMSEEDVAAAPLSGSLFVAEPGATGLEEVRFATPLFGQAH